MGEFGWTEAMLLLLSVTFLAWIAAIFLLVYSERWARANGYCAARGLGTKACPNCSGPMRSGFILLGGGVWFSTSKEVFTLQLNPDISPEERERLEGLRQREPLSCLVHPDAYLQGHGFWPKEAFFCWACDTFAISWAERSQRAAAGETSQSEPPAIGPNTTTPVRVCCCLCNRTILNPTGPAHSLDPCLLDVTSNLNKHPRYRKNMNLFCHFECLQRVSGGAAGVMSRPEFPTRGQLDRDNFPESGTPS
jgi:hypothetical protein